MSEGPYISLTSVQRLPEPVGDDCCVCDEEKKCVAFDRELYHSSTGSGHICPACLSTVLTADRALRRANFSRPTF